MSDALFDLTAQPELLTVTAQERQVSSDVAKPVARVCVDTPFSWPDKIYDYLVPATLDETARPGVRVRVRFAGKLATGFLLARSSTTTASRLAPVEKVLGVPVLTEETTKLTALIAETMVAPRYDVLRSAIPPRHARAERAALEAGAITPGPVSATGYQAPPGQSVVAGGAWTIRVACEAATGALARDESVLILVPTALDVTETVTCLADLVNEPIATLTSDMGAETRYRHFVSIAAGRTRIVVGTRSAAYAPLNNIGLIIVVDEGNGAHRDKRSPYATTLDIALARATIINEEPARQVRLLRLTYPPRLEVTSREIERIGPWPKISSADMWVGDQRGILPQAAFSVINDGLKTGPVLLSAPRPGYVPALVCQKCNARAVCTQCATPLAVPAPGSPPTCPSCGHGSWRCTTCSGENLRAMRRGSERLGQELARAFPHARVDVIRSAEEPSTGSLVIATPGAEPHRQFATSIILEPATALASLSLDAEGQALRHWASVASRTTDHLLLAGIVPSRLVAALERRTLPWTAEDRAERDHLAQPPYHRWFRISGERQDVQELLGRTALAIDAPQAPASLADMLAGGGAQAFAPGIFLVGPTPEGTGISVMLHERSPASRLVAGLHRGLSTRLRVRVEADPVL